MKNPDTKTRTKISGYILNVLFLLIHMLMLNLFMHYDVKPMVYFNIFSIAFYLFCFLLVHNNNLRLYIILTYFEVITHMSMAVYFTGWQPGFQICLIGMSILAFSSEYLTNSYQIKKVSGLFLSICGMAAYLIMCIISYHHQSAYSFPKEVNYSLQLLWGVTVFVVSISLLQLLLLQIYNIEKYLRERAGKDELTDLANRYSADDFISNEVSSNPDRFWISIIDIDDFKMINDSYGHNYGDYVLRTVADIMRKTMSEEKVYRWGGEEFLIIGNYDNDYDQIVEKLEVLRKNVEDFPFSFEDRNTQLTITIGVALHEKDEDIYGWINKADARLYKGKRSGKNKVVKD